VIVLGLKAARGSLQLVNEPLHSTMEAFGAVAALMLAAMLLRKGRENTPTNTLLATGFMGMGIMSGFHAVSSIGNGFVLQYAAANLIGGAFFAAVWLFPPDGIQLRIKWLPWVVAAGSLLLGLFIAIFRPVLPAMMLEDGFTATAMVVNTVASVLFLAAAAYFIRDAYHTGVSESYLFAYLFLVFGLSNIEFFASDLWSGTWWFWHTQRLVASGVVLIYLFMLYRRAEDQLHILNKSLERQVAERTARLSYEIDERTLAEKKIAESEEKFRTFFESANDALFIIDMQGKILDTNTVAYERLGYTKDELLSLPLSRLDHPSFIDMIPERIARLKQFGRISVESMHVRKDGSVMPVEINAKTMDLNGQDVIISVIRDITDRKETETALKETNAKLQSLIHALPDAVFFKDTGGRYLLVNNALQQFIGIAPESVVGRTDDEFMPADIADGCRKSDEALMRSGEPLSLEDVLIGKDGGKIYVESIKIPVKDSKGDLLGLVGVSRNVTERKKAEIILRDAVRNAQEEKARTEAFISAIGDGITVHDCDYQVIYQNQVANTVFGNRVGEHCYKAYHNRDVICDNCHFPDTLRDGKIRKVEVMKTIADKLVYLEITSSPLKDATGNIIGGIELFRDITYRKQAEAVLLRSNEELEILIKERTAELTMLNDQLRNLSVHLQNARESERTMIAREIHDDLGQSLTALKMELSFLQKKLPRSQDKLIEKAESMTGLIDTTIQSVKRISSELRPGVLDHLGLSAAIEWQAQEFAKRSGIPCQVVFEPREIELDKDRTTALFRIFQEALTNIARHANATEISVLLRAQNDDLLLQVRDNGRGISENEKTDPKSLGLIGIRERVHNWGGSLSIAGIPDRGTTVTVWFPLEGAGVMP
jgi:PAS domain S-box-containing protein